MGVAAAVVASKEVADALVSLFTLFIGGGGFVGGSDCSCGSVHRLRQSLPMQ